MKKKLLILLGSLLIILVMVGVWVVWQLLRPAHMPAEKVVFSVTQGEGVNQISRNLKSSKLIADSFIFETYVWAIKSENKIIAGRYDLTTNLNVLQLTNVLLGGSVAKDDNITLIEGWNRHEYAKRLADSGFDQERFLQLTSSTTAWRDDYPLLVSIPEGKNLEGYLFPDTYRLNSQSTVDSLVIRMLDNFEKKVSGSLLQDIIAGQHTLYEVVTMASIIEREVPLVADRKMIADIFWKRLDAGIGLQSDATINFAKCIGAADFASCEKNSRSSAADLQLDSLYNTYKYKGLPPGPISNPGLDSLEAAVHPTANPYYYFLTDEQGKVYYARTLEEHKKNRELYLGR